MSLRDPRYNPRKLLLAATASDTSNEEQLKLLVEYRGLHSFWSEEKASLEQLESFVSENQSAFKSLSLEAQSEIQQKITTLRADVDKLDLQLDSLAYHEQLRGVVRTAFERVREEDSIAFRAERSERLQREAKERAERALERERMQKVSPGNVASSVPRSQDASHEHTPAKSTPNVASPHPVSPMPPVRRSPKIEGLAIFLIIGFFVVLFAFISRFLLSTPDTTPETVSGVATTEPKQIVSTAPKNNYPKVSAEDGDVLIYNDYVGTCPFEINLSVREQTHSDFFVFLEFVSIFPEGSDPETVITYVEQGKSFKSGDMRELGNYAQWKKEKEPNYKPRANLGVYLSTTTTYTTDIPPGCYRIWYCSGETWYGTDHYFGDDTVWYTSDDILVFYKDDNYTYGQTITLFLVEDGNMDTRTAYDFELPNDLK